MCADQREAIVVLLHLLHGYLPSSNCVTLLAIRSHLPFVNIGMAVLAALSDARKDGPHVALCTSHECVHTAQRILRLIVIKFRDRADRLPRIRCMAVLAGDIQVPVRAMSSAEALSPCAYRHCGECQQKNRDRSEYTPSPHGLAPGLRS